MESEEQDALNQDIYLALGRFVVCFSHLLDSLEESTIFLLDLWLDSKRNILIKAALADRTAYPISSAFFSVFFKKWGDLVTDDDYKIMKCLRKEIQDTIETRNRIMHDAWMSQSVGGDPGPHPMSLSRVRTHGWGADYNSVDYGPSELNALANNTKRLARIVNNIVWYSKDDQNGPEVADRFEIREGQVCAKET